MKLNLTTQKATALKYALAFALDQQVPSVESMTAKDNLRKLYCELYLELERLIPNDRETSELH